MVNYNNGKIYKIIDNTNGNIYIGSTTKQYLSQRLTTHVKNYKLFLNGKGHFVTSFKIIENNDYYIELIELYFCNSKDELHAREGYHIRNNECVNNNIPGRTRKEWREDNKNEILEREKDYYEVNKEKILERVKDYYEDNREKILEQRKAYHESNREKIKEYKKNYHKANRDKIKEKYLAKKQAKKEETDVEKECDCKKLGYIYCPKCSK